MKKLLNLVVAGTMLALALACTKEENNLSVEFTQTAYTVYKDGSVVVSVTASSPFKEAVSVPVTFNGSAVKGSDFSVSAESFDFEAGASESEITVRNLGLTSEKQLALALVPASGYKLGNKSQAVVLASSEESLIFTFDITSNQLFERYEAVVTLQGVESGESFKAATDLVIPIKVSCDVPEHVSYPVTVVVPAGQNTTVFPVSYVGDPLSVEVVTGDSVPVFCAEVDKAADSRYIDGSDPELILAVCGPQLPSHLVGRWAFGQIFDVEELALWFEEYEDDVDLLPLDNEGLELVIEQGEDGKVYLSVDGKGDFCDFFCKEKAELTLASPKNTVANSVMMGAHTQKESNMFIADADKYDSSYQVPTFYTLSKVNRAFSSKVEKFGPAVISFRLIHGDLLEMCFREYDTPPFGEMWWDDASFDPEMFGFACWFTRK